jgi:hypothetical protein
MLGRCDHHVWRRLQVAILCQVCGYHDDTNDKFNTNQYIDGIADTDYDGWCIVEWMECTRVYK